MLLLSYPKSGRTWLRFMIDDYLCRVRGLDTGNVFEVESRPDYPVQWTHLTAAMIMKLPYHSMGCFDRRPLEGTTCILMVRNFYATLASAYHQATQRIGVFTGSPSAFIRNPRYGVIKLVTFYNLWMEIAGLFRRQDVISYDQMLADPAPALRRVLAMLGEEADDSLLETVAREASLESMKRLSVMPAYAGTVLAPRDPENPDSFKIRRGGSSDVGALFSEEDLIYIERVIRDLLLLRNADWLEQCVRRPSSCVRVVQ